MLFDRNIGRIIPSFTNFARIFSLKNNVFDSALGSPIKDIFSPEQHAKILETLNKSTPEDLSRYKISNAKIKYMLDWKRKKGPFKSLTDVLEVEGFGEKMLENICKRITDNNVTEVKRQPIIKNKRAKNLLIPEMSVALSTSLESAVAIHLHLTGIGWTKLESTNTLIEWKCKSFSTLPAKMMPLDTFNLAVDIIRMTPVGDAYIFEAPANLSPQRQTKQGLVSAFNQQIELISMLFSLLNTSKTHNRSLQSAQTHIQNIENRVFYLKSRIPARLFNTFIGYEKVSGISAIMGILNKDSECLQSLPCTPVTFDYSLNQYFTSSPSIYKELLAQALMLGMSFMDLCIYKNVACYQALKLNRDKKKEQPLKELNLG